MSDGVAAAAPRWEDVLTRELADRGLSRGEFDRMVSQPLHRLSRSDLHTLLEVRDAMPPIAADDVAQKILPPEQVRNLLGATYFDSLVEPGLVRHLDDAATWTHASGSRAGTPAVDMAAAPDRLTGYVARVADVTGLPTSRLYHDLGLNYVNSTFTGDTSMFGVRFHAGDHPSLVTDTTHQANQPLEVLRDALFQPALDGSGRSRFDEIQSMPHQGDRQQAWYDFADANGGRSFQMAQAIDGANPHRGNGFGGTGGLYAPEFTFGRTALDMPTGAEMWQIRPDGSTTVVAIFDGTTWVHVS